MSLCHSPVRNFDQKFMQPHRSFAQDMLDEHERQIIEKENNKLWEKMEETLKAHHGIFMRELREIRHEVFGDRRKKKKKLLESMDYLDDEEVVD